MPKDKGFSVFQEAALLCVLPECLYCSERPVLHKVLVIRPLMHRHPQQQKNGHYCRPNNNLAAVFAPVLARNGILRLTEILLTDPIAEFHAASLTRPRLTNSAPAALPASASNATPPAQSPPHPARTPATPAARDAPAPVPAPTPPPRPESATLPASAPSPVSRARPFDPARAQSLS